MTLEGEFEILSEGEWIKLPAGQTAVSPRGSVHAFHNSDNALFEANSRELRV